MVEFCDEAKLIYYALMYVGASREEDAVEAQAMLADFDATMTIPLEARVYTIRKLCAAAKTLQAVSNILPENDWQKEPFYVRAHYGEFWNEVEMPRVVEKTFEELVESVKADYAGMLGVEESVDITDYKNGNVCIAYYDLSDIAVVFSSAAALTAFLGDNENIVDTVSTMRYSDGAWTE